MFDIVLFEPEIPPNTGNIIRLTANTGVRLHLVEPLGFSLEDRQLKRAGLDYHEMANVCTHRDWPTCRSALARRRIFALSARAQTDFFTGRYLRDDVFVFGPETRGLPQAVLAEIPPPHRYRLPMRAGNRSLNLSNAAAIVVFEAWRQLGFPGAV